MGGSTGRVWKFGDNVDTDAILPAQYLNRTDPRELAEHCFEVTDPDFCREAKEGITSSPGPTSAVGHPGNTHRWP